MQATAAGVLPPARSTAFGPTRVVSGEELLDAVSRFQRLAGPLAGRDRPDRAMTHLTAANQLTLLRMLLIPAFVIQVLSDGSAGPSSRF